MAYSKLDIKKMGFASKAELADKIIELRANMKPFNEIASSLGFSSTKSLRSFCESNNVNTKYRKRCIICGNEFTTNVGKALACSDECKRKYKTEITNKKRRKPGKMGRCSFCGKPFLMTGNQKKYCSLDCSRKFRGNKRNILKRVNGECDESITLYEVYCKDKGVCYLCGKEVDWEDKKPSYKTMICGSDYPTIDHVIPLKSGGTHTWENVRLACRACNCQKKEIPLEKYVKSHPK